MKKNIIKIIAIIPLTLAMTFNANAKEDVYQYICYSGGKVISSGYVSDSNYASTHDQCTSAGGRMFSIPVE